MSYADQAYFNNYDPSSFGWPRGGPLVPFSFAGSTFGQCARDVKNVFTAVLTELVPHIPGGINFGPHDDWAYSATDDLAGGRWSFHHYGIAFDLNWLEDPMGDYSTNPDAGRRGSIPHAAASAIAHKYGCEYGGDWSGGEGHRGFKDYMHFECHLSPSVARTVTATSEEFTVDSAAKAAFDALEAKFKGADGRDWAVENLILEVLNPRFAQLEKDNAAMKAQLAAIAKKVGA